MGKVKTQKCSFELKYACLKLCFEFVLTWKWMLTGPVEEKQHKLNRTIHTIHASIITMSSELGQLWDSILGHIETNNKLQKNYHIRSQFRQKSYRILILKETSTIPYIKVKNEKWKCSHEQITLSRMCSWPSESDQRNCLVAQLEQVYFVPQLYDNISK